MPFSTWKSPAPVLPEDDSRYVRNARLELLLLSEEHGEADNGAINEQSADDAHNHSLNADLLGMSEYDGKCCMKC